MKRLFLIIIFAMTAIVAFAQSATYFYDSNKIVSDDKTASLYSVIVMQDKTYVTIELIPRKNLKRLEYFTSPYTYVKAGNVKLHIIGALSRDNTIHDCFAQDHWGWSDAKAGKSYLYTLVFSGKIPKGITTFSLIDDNESYHGYSFRNYTLNNPGNASSWNGNQCRTLNGSEDMATVSKYLSENIGSLNPIEGIYDVTYVQQYEGGNRLYGLQKWSGREKNTTAAIFKNEDGTLSCKLYFRDRVQQKRWGLASEILSISQIGSTNAYRVSGFYIEEYSHFGNSGCVRFDFSSRFSIQDSGFNVSFLGGDSFHQVEGTLSFIKEYPMAEEDDVSKNTSEWSGTGFALKDGFVITNYHVIENAATISIYGIKGDFHSAHSAYVVASDKSNDIALLKINDNHFGGFRDIPYSVKNTMAEVGEDVFTLGYPLTAAMGDETKYTTGVISSRTGFQGDASSYQISVPIQPGNSGGPLFDSKGNIIGIVTAKISSAENVGYAIKSSFLKHLVESRASSDIIPLSNTISSLSRTEQIKRLRNYVFIIKCSDKVPDTSATLIVQTSVDGNESKPSVPDTSTTLNVRRAESDSKSSHERQSSSSGSMASSSASKISISSQKPNRQIDNNGVTITDFINAKAKESQLSVTKIRIQDSQTIVDFECGGKKTDDDFINIERSAVIIVDGKTYSMRKVGGIKIAPEKHYFNVSSMKFN